MLGASGNALARRILTSWCQLLSELRVEREIEDLKAQVNSYRVKQETTNKKAMVMLLGSADTALSRGIITAWYQLLLELAREKEVERLKAEVLQYRAQGESVTRKAMSMLLGSNGTALLRKVFLAWIQALHDHSMESELRELHEEVERLRAKQGAAKERAAAMLLGSQGSGMAKMVITAWWKLRLELASERHAERLQLEISKYQAQKEISVRRALSMLRSSEGIGLLTEVFSAWHQFQVDQTRSKHSSQQLLHWEQIAMQSKARQQAAAQQACASMLGSVDGLLIREVLTTWKKLLLKAEQDREFETLQQQIAKFRAQQEGIQRKALAMLAGSSGNALKRQLLVTWRQLLVELRRNKEVEKLRNELQHMHAKQDTATRQALGMFLGSSSAAFLQEIFVAWRQFLRDFAHSNEVERLREEVTRYRMQQEAGVRKAMSMAVASSGTALLKEVFTFWQQGLADLRQAREMERLQEVVFQQQLRQANASRKALMMLEGSSGTAFVREVLSVWHRFVLAVRKNSEVEKLQQEVIYYQFRHDSAGTAGRKALKAAFESSGSGLLLSVITSWRQLLKELVLINANDRLKQELLRYQMKDQARTAQALGMLLGSSVSALLRRSFSGWNQLLHELCSEREIENLHEKVVTLTKEVAHRRRQQESATKRIMTAMVSSSGSAFAREIFAAWLNLLLEMSREQSTQKLKQEVMQMRMKQDSIAKKSVAMLAGSSNGTLLKEIIAVWQRLLLELSRERTIQKLKAEVLQIRMQQDSAARKSIAVLMGSSISALLQDVFGTWHKHWVEMLQERQMENLRQEALQARMQQNATSKKALGKFLGLSSGALVKNVFAKWHQHLSEIAREKEVENLRQEVLHYRMQHDVAKRKALAEMVGSSSSVLKQAVFGVWQQLLSELSWESKAKKLEEEVQRLRAAQDQRKQRAGAMLLSQGSVLTRAVLSAWWTLRVELGRERQIEQLREQLLRFRARQDGVARKAVGMLAGSQGNSLLLEVLTAWHHVLQEELRTRRMEHLHLSLKTQQRSMMYQVVGRIASSQGKALLQEAFSMFRQIVLELQRQHYVRNLQRELIGFESALETQVQRTTLLLMGSHRTAVLRRSFTAWFHLHWHLLLFRHEEQVRELSFHQRACWVQKFRYTELRILARETLVYWKIMMYGIRQERLSHNMQQENILLMVKRDERIRKMLQVVFGAQPNVWTSLDVGVDGE
eukprot:gnl/MRDRNA2_/MRDRNA2_129082_c0_seq1.p1 gnl/MRDRNA2_/MRDRNA2_129082_c0~~gnl/MRDRNA2_/MRDRNA2_129082_c0_seq1.p1  ORF type:complete len:1411 (-),score=348.41 gnl/MRDRNA2_/MRDRNA2_129082_c0_seq1:6-3638(-)